MSRPEIDFSSFIMSLATSVLIALGENPDPVSGETSVNLQLARDTIRILEIIEEKTRGNLMEEERRLLENILFDLRFKYVAKARQEDSGRTGD